VKWSRPDVWFSELAKGEGMNRIINSKPLLFPALRVTPDPRAAMILEEKRKALSSAPGELHRRTSLDFGSARRRSGTA
jgi:hypothetical protein